MITHENIKEVIASISLKDKKRIKKTVKEYIVLILHCFNAGSNVEVILTNDFNKYKNVSNYGNCILSTSDYIFKTI